MMLFVLAILGIVIVVLGYAALRHIFRIKP